MNRDFLFAKPDLLGREQDPEQVLMVCALKARLAFQWFGVALTKFP